MLVLKELTKIMEQKQNGKWSLEGNYEWGQRIGRLIRIGQDLNAF